jgi:hypothetical protein
MSHVYDFLVLGDGLPLPVPGTEWPWLMNAIREEIENQ